jgi:hypothetical protein
MKAKLSHVSSDILGYETYLVGVPVTKPVAPDNLEPALHGALETPTAGERIGNMNTFGFGDANVQAQVLTLRSRPWQPPAILIAILRLPSISEPTINTFFTSALLLLFVRTAIWRSYKILIAVASHAVMAASSSLIAPHDKTCTETGNRVEALPRRIGIWERILGRALEMRCEVSV